MLVKGYVVNYEGRYTIIKDEAIVMNTEPSRSLSPLGSGDLCQKALIELKLKWMTGLASSIPAAAAAHLSKLLITGAQT